MQTPSFGFGQASATAFGAAPAAGIAKTSSTPLFGAAAPAAAAPSPFGAAPAAFSFGGAAPAASPSPFATPQPAVSPSPFGAPPAAGGFSFAGGAFGAPAQQPAQQQQQQLSPLGFQPAAAPDDSAIRELQSLRDAYVPAPGNHRYRFARLLLNVVADPAQRVKPPDVDELAWREALARAGGPDNPDNLWPVLARGFGDLLARKAAQDAAIAEHGARLEALRRDVATLGARQEAALREQLAGAARRHAELCARLLTLLRHVDLAEGRFAAAARRAPPPRAAQAALEAALARLEAALGPGAGAGLAGRVEALAAAARLSGGGGAPGAGGTAEAPLDAASMRSVHDVLAGYGEALARMQGVLGRAARDVGVLEEAVARGGAA